MAFFLLDFQLTTGLQPQLVFGGASYPDGFDPRSSTMWSVAGDAVTYQSGQSLVTANETYWYLFGNGFDVNPLQQMPTSGTITSLYHVIPSAGVAPPATPAGIIADRVFTAITGLNINAADFFAAALAGTADDLILSGNDVFESAYATNFHIATPITLRMGAGNDVARATGTGDLIWGEEGDDRVVLLDVADNLVNTKPGSTVDGGLGDDTLTGGGYRDQLIGGEGLDRLLGGKSNDTITGGADRDRIYGGDQNDVVIASASDIVAGEIMAGGAGTDTLVLYAEPDLITDIADTRVTGFEVLQMNGDLRLLQGQFEQFSRIEYSASATLYLADAGLTDLGGDIVWFNLSVGAPQFTVQGSAGRDIINGRDSGFADILNGGAGNDVLNGGSGNDTLRGEKGNDALNGDSGNDLLEGSEGQDRLAGSTGNDALLGGAGNDLLNGGEGADTLDGGTGLDTVAYDTSRSGLVISLDAIEGNTGDAAGDVFLNIENLRGSRFADTLTGNVKSNLIEGAGGNDSLGGGTGLDTLNGGDGDDRLTGGAGADVLRGGTGNDTFIFSVLSDSRLDAADLIADFVPGDIIDVSAVIAGVFVFNDVSGPIGGGTAAIWIDTSSLAETVVFLDTGNGGLPEMAIRLTGSLEVLEQDFLL